MRVYFEVKCVCMCVCARARVRACVRMCVCAVGVGEGGRWVPVYYEVKLVVIVWLSFFRSPPPCRFTMRLGNVISWSLSVSTFSDPHREGL